MHKLAKELIKQRIDILIDEFDFEKRRSSNSEECICYQQNKKCHDLENLNCLFCYCPFYDLSAKEGGCKMNSSKGKYVGNCQGKIWDCSDCDFPHKKENVKDILLKLYNLEQ